MKKEILKNLNSSFSFYSNSVICNPITNGSDGFDLPMFLWGSMKSLGMALKQKVSAKFKYYQQTQYIRMIPVIIQNLKTLNHGSGPSSKKEK